MVPVTILVMVRLTTAAAVAPPAVAAKPQIQVILPVAAASVAVAVAAATLPLLAEIGMPGVPPGGTCAHAIEQIRMTASESQNRFTRQLPAP